MSTTFRIPKQTDREIAAALGRIRAGLADLREFKIFANPQYANRTDLDPVKPEETLALNYIFDLKTRAIPTLQLTEKNNAIVLSIHRKHDKIYDEAILEDDWVNALRSEERDSKLSKIHTRLLGLVQKELRCDDLVAAFSGFGDSEWNCFRASQIEVLNSLQQTTQHVLVDSTKQIEAARAAEQKKCDDLRTQLRKEFEAEQTRLANEHALRMKALDAREEELKAKLAIYETHETLYVARKKTEEQLDQLKEWLEDSSLTKETVKKRLPVLVAYIAAMLICAALTVLFAYQNYELLKAVGPNLSQLPWWQWVSLTVKTIVPVAAFTTFAVYFIRWEGAWARQHADEELRTRARIIDIGRSSWLLEAVRNDKEGISPELIRELSKNLFTNVVPGDGTDLHPQAFTDLLMQNLSTIKVTGSDGSAVKATRGGKNKK
ncbi:MAG: hypothetical protein HZA31_04200 [Opitutae bacterium]|nr:hypothetical protein [Opitutae bacterium]